MRLVTPLVRPLVGPIAAPLVGSVEGGEAPPVTPPGDFAPSLDFSDARNSQYLALILEDI